MNDTTSEAQLLQASVAGSKEAFGAVVRRCQALVCAVTYSATGWLLIQTASANDWLSFGAILACDILIFFAVAKFATRYIRRRATREDQTRRGHK